MKPSVINGKVNLALFLYLCFASTLNYLYGPKDTNNVYWDKVYEWSTAVAVIATVLFVFILAIWGSVLARLFWNRFVSDVFKTREINFNEALAVVLIFAILALYLK